MKGLARAPRIGALTNRGDTKSRCPNLRRRMTLCPPELNHTLRKTADPNDRAHDVFDGNMLVPASQLGDRAKPRAYPQCYMVGGVSTDTCAERLAWQVLRLRYELGFRDYQSASDASYRGLDAMLWDLENSERSLRAGIGSPGEVRRLSRKAARKTLQRLIDARQSRDSRHPDERQDDRKAEAWSEARGESLPPAF